MGKSILIGDAGGSKTDWRLIKDDQITQYSTVGFNAFTHSISAFKESISENIDERQIDQLFLYCAGADTDDQRNEVARELSEIFKSEIKVENDLLGAARATCGHEKGYACILGTGANASYYDGNQMEKVSASLGYVLGDEGSGAYLGRKLLKGIYRNQLSAEVISSFMDEFALPVDEAIRSIYGAEKPNQYLATFVPFILSQKADGSIYQLITEAFSEFFKEFLSSADKNLKVHFSGSVAYHFSDILRQVASDLNYIIGTIIDSPISGLVLYHKDE